MEESILYLQSRIYSNNNNLLLEIINDLQKLISQSKDNMVITAIKGIINKMNYIKNENQKNFELIRSDIQKLSEKFDKLNLNINNSVNKKEIKQKNGTYFGQIVDGIAEGKGIWYGTEEPFIGHRYEGDWKNNKKEGKGIYYYNNGDRYEGNFINDKYDGKGVFYFSNGNRYEGNFKNDKREGEGILYYNNGDRMMGDYIDDKKIGLHVRLTKKGKVKEEKFSLK